MTGYKALASRVRASLAELEEVVARTERLRDKAVESGDSDYWDGVALNLHAFYTGVEQIFEDIARTVDGSLPAGSQWHRDLLLQMSAEMADTRPAVISRDSYRCLEQYLGFRHVVRNVYSFHLVPNRIEELVALLPSCHDAIDEDGQRFADFLEELGRPG